MRILLAHEQPLVRRGLRALLEAAPERPTVLEADDGRRALELIRAGEADVAVLDLQLAGISGVELARRLLDDHHARTALVLISPRWSASALQLALELNISGYSLLSDARADLLEAIHAAGRGDCFVSPLLHETMVEALRQREKSRPVTISPRQRDVLCLLAEGLRTKEIAAQLKLSAKTVEGYRETLMERLDIHSIAGLVRYALQQHLTAL